MGFENVGKVWAPSEFCSYLETVTPPAWCNSITLHHTAFPDLDMRPNGLTVQHIKNIQHGYVNDNGWSTGPHLFIDDNRALGMCPLTQTGIHAASYNSRSIGIEVLGNYDDAAPNTGRGASCWNVATEIGFYLLKWMKAEIDSTTVFFHRDDPKTSKSCPGKKVEKTWVLEKIKSHDVIGWNGEC